MALSNLSSILKENKLVGENYNDRLRNLNLVLIAEGHKFVLEEVCPQKPDEGSNEAQKVAYDKWVRSNEISRCYILASMSSVLQYQHEPMKTAYDIMYNLRQLFGHQNHSARHLAMKKLMDARMSDSTPVRDHILMMMGYLSEIETLGRELDGDSQIDIVLHSLSSKFEQKKRNAPKKAADEVPKVKKPKAKIPPEEFKSKTKCFKCGQPATCSTQSWVVDTGATDHVCISLQGFLVKRQLSEDEITVYMGNATRVVAVAVGDVVLPFSSDRTLVLKDCLYVPGFRRNLISVSKLIMDGYYVSFNNKVVIFSGKHFICSGTLDGHLYFLKPIENTTQRQLLNTSIINPNKRKEPSELNQTYLWHLRLGHINLKRIQRLVNDGPLSSLVLESFALCESYLEDSSSLHSCSVQSHFVSWFFHFVSCINSTLRGGQPKSEPAIFDHRKRKVNRTAEIGSRKSRMRMAIQRRFDEQNQGTSQNKNIVATHTDCPEELREAYAKLEFKHEKEINDLVWIWATDVWFWVKEGIDRRLCFNGIN
ncbi:hypothetical protein C2S53_000141 [Perilla frutescens var. hirtella]|uniref:GAG-pre-integrase domain-containing protein n=1 Tax=Perilla frutescens var. hirtella TaxID=608512 RepID=A0AAD4P1G8_PERFH|nr:hypothetical protein C2S53_000141 [Perilla frutescens var. hirtella]